MSFFFCSHGKKILEQNPKPTVTVGTIDTMCIARKVPYMGFQIPLSSSAD